MFFEKKSTGISNCNKPCGPCFILIITVRNVVAARYCFHKRLSFCSRGADTPQQTATAADGTHPTGMHSCLRMWLVNCTIFTSTRVNILNFLHVCDLVEYMYLKRENSTTTYIRTVCAGNAIQNIKLLQLKISSHSIYWI